AAMLGLPYAFASHFAPAELMPALEIYRREFRPSSQLNRPYVAAGVNVFAPDIDSAAHRLFTSAQQAFLNLTRGRPGRLPPPVDALVARWSPAEKAQVSAMLKYSFVGDCETVHRGLSEFQHRT